MGAAAIAAAVILSIFGWPWRLTHVTQVRVGWILGVGVGFFLGCWFLDLWPRWPPGEDRDRLLALVLPSVLGVELLACFAQVPQWLTGLLRLVVVGATGRVLLHGSSYITDFAGPGTRDWSTLQAWLIFGGLAGVLALVSVLLAILARRAPGLSHAICWAGTIAGAAITVMLSGYATGGQVGLPLAAAILGGVCSAILLPAPTRGPGPLGIAVVGLFGLLVIGRFFGQLTTSHFALLFCAPLLGWLPELPFLRKIPPWLRGLLRVLLVAFLVSGVMFHAQRTFDTASNTPSGSRSEEPSIQDYMDLKR
jgi:hypothetical protein